MRLEPFLNVSNGPDAIEFYKAAFGANVLFLIPPETGSTVAQLEISGATFWLSDESPEYQPVNTRSKHRPARPHR